MDRVRPAMLIAALVSTRRTHANNAPSISPTCRACSAGVLCARSIIYSMGNTRSALLYVSHITVRTSNGYLKGVVWHFLVHNTGAGIGILDAESPEDPDGAYPGTRCCG